MESQERSGNEVQPEKDAAQLTLADTTNQSYMEVHHHPDLKHEHKKWKEYFLEFFMIFIAVTLGFFAENLREHISEKNTEREYVESFAGDLSSDTLKLKQIIPQEKLAVSSIDTLFQLLTQSSYGDTDINKMYYLLRKFAMSFDPMTFNQRSYTQLKNAGGLRLIKKKAASDSIVAYNKSIDDINSTINYTTHDFMVPAIYKADKIFDLKYLTGYTPETLNQLLFSKAKLSLITTDKALLTEFSNLLYQVKEIRMTYLKQLIYQNEKAEKMITFFHSEYNF